MAGLTQISMSQNLQWTMQGVASGSFTPAQQGSDSIVSSLNGISTTTWNQLFAAQYSIPFGNTQSFDLTNFTNLVGQTGLAFTKVIAMTITVSGTGTNIQWKPSASNGLVWPVADVSDKIELQDGGSFTYSMGASSTGKVVDSTHKSIDLINTAGSGTAVVKVAILGSTI